MPNATKGQELDCLLDWLDATRELGSLCPLCHTKKEGETIPSRHIKLFGLLPLEKS